ncbi:lipase family protein [Rhodococcus sp. NPDC058514]|uniref:lipase family protein n=1 Tax=unclassified Rhodococcus (in: high G+C Gram-positive bacteria) TaxID=192944 RepID=UPI00366791FB
MDRQRIRALASVLVAVVIAALGLPAMAGAGPGAAGEVLSTENLSAAASIPGAGAGHRLTYRTTDHSGAPTVSGGAIHVPPGPAPVGGWPVVSYAHGTVGVADLCAPSTSGQSQAESAYLARWLARGYAVVATDYAGLGTPGSLAYLDGVAAAHNVIDMVRAARAVVPALSPRWVVAGLSQGGQAAMLTARLATGYAPELDYRGAVALGVPSNLDRLFPLAGPGIPDLGLAGLTKFMLFTMMGMRDARPELHVDQFLSPKGRELAATAERVCTVALNPYVAGVAVGDLFSRPLGTEEMRRAMTDYLGLPTAGYDRPVFLGQGARDLVVPIPLTLAFAGELAASRTDLTFLTYPGADHLGTPAASFDDSVPFVDRLMR